MARKAKITSLDEIDLQKIRISALDLQLRSLRFQAQALDAIGTEHTSGLDLGAGRYFKYLDETVCRFVKYVKEFLTVADTMPPREAQSWLSTMAAWKTTIIGQAHEEEVFRFGIAAARVKADIAGRPVSPLDDIPSDWVGQELKAHSFCLSAEKAQLNTFVMQVAATCNLALEVALTAAAEANKKRESQSVK